jgi:hypothetical protein
VRLSNKNDNLKAKKDRGMAQVTQHLVSQHKDLSLNPSTVGKKGKRKKEKEKVQ